MSDSNLDFKMRLQAETSKFTQNIQAALREMQALNQAARALDDTDKDGHDGLKIMQQQAAAVRDALKEAAAAAKTIGKTAKQAAAPSEENKQAAEAKAAKQAAKEREKAEKELSRQLAAEAAKIEKLRRQAERNAEAEAKRAAKEREKTERETAQAMRILARDVERERVRAERAAAAEAKQAAAEQKAAAERAAQAARAGQQWYAGLHRTLGLRPRNEIITEIQRTKQAFAALKNAGNLPRAEFQRLQAAYRSQLRQLNQELGHLPKTDMKPLAQSIGGIGKAALGAVASVAALGAGLQAVLATTREFQAVGKRLEYAFGSAAEGARQMAFVRQEANRLGLEVLSAANGYAQFASATKDLNITQEQTQKVFQGVASATAAMGLSADEANGVFLALSQIAGKGKVSMEELRGQLGERLTPAMAIAAKSMGVTTAELEKMVEKGLAAEVFLPKFGAALEEAFAGEAAKNADTLNGQINLLQNRFKELLNSLGEGGIADAAVAVMKEIGQAIDWVDTKLSGLDGALTGAAGDAFRQLGDTLKELAQTAYGLFDAVFETVNDIGGAIASLAGQSESDFNLLTAVLDGLNLALGAFRDGLGTLQIGWEFLAGSILTGLSHIAKAFARLLPDFLGGDKLEEMGRQLEQSAEKHFGKAQELAENFESKTTAALDKIAERREQNAQKHLSKLQQEQEKAHQALVDNAAQNYQRLQKTAKEAADNAAAAQIAAHKAVGTASEQAARQQAETAKTAAQAAQAAADEAAQALAGLSGSVPTESVKSLEQALKDAKGAAQGLGVDVSAAMNSTTPAMQGVLDNTEKLTDNLSALKQQGADAAQLIGGALEKAVKTAANAADIEALKQQLLNLREESVLSAQETERWWLAADNRLQELNGGVGSAQEAFKKLGINSHEAAALSARELKQAFAEVRSSGSATADSLKQALFKALSGADHAEQLAVIREQFVELGREGKLSAQEVSAGLLDVEQRLHQLNGSIDPVEAAFKKLGLQSKESLRLSAEEARQAFEIIKAQGAEAGNGWQHSQQVISAAFEKAAEAALKSGDSSSTAWVRSQAAAHGYTVVVDESGKAALKSAAEVEQAAVQQVQAHEKAADAAAKAADAAKDGAEAQKETGRAVSDSLKPMNDYQRALDEIARKTKAYQFVGTQSWVTVGEHIRATYDTAQSAIKGLNTATENGIGMADRLAHAEAVALSNADKLDKASLDNLHAAIDKARQKMQALADDAKQTREDLQASLDELNGDSDAGARLAQQRKIAELRKKQQQAERTGNRDAAADYAQSVELQQQIWQRQQAKKAEEAARQQREAEERARAEAERKQQEAERRRRPEIGLPEPAPVSVKIDPDRLLQALAARDEKVAGMAVGQVVDALEQAAKREQ